jgi:hypothetical protein
MNSHFALKLVFVAFAAFGAAFPTLSFGFCTKSARRLGAERILIGPGSPASFPSFSWSSRPFCVSAAVKVFTRLYCSNDSRQKHECW